MDVLGDLLHSARDRQRFIEYLDAIQSLGDDYMVTVVIPEFLPSKWWQHILHNQTALLIKGALLFRKNTVVADVPYLLKR